MTTMSVMRGEWICGECGGAMLRDARVCANCPNSTNWQLDDSCIEIEVELDARFFGGDPEDIEAGLLNGPWRWNAQVRRTLPVFSFPLTRDEEREAADVLREAKRAWELEVDYQDDLDR